MAKNVLILSLLFCVLHACFPSEKIQQAVQIGIAETKTALPSNTASPTDSPSPTSTYTPQPSQTPHPTDTATPKPSPTLPSTITPTPHPTVSPTPSITPTSTNTPVLPSLENLILTIDELNAIDDRWYSPAYRLWLKYEDATKINCDIDCIGFQAEGYDDQSTLTYILYRVSSPQDAVNAVFGAETLYTTNQGFKELSPGNLPLSQQSTWLGSRNQREYILYSAQGPAVLAIFWQSAAPLDETTVVNLLVQYTQDQIERLRLNMYTN